MGCMHISETHCITRNLKVNSYSSCATYVLLLVAILCVTVNYSCVSGVNKHSVRSSLAKTKVQDQSLRPSFGLTRSSSVLALVLDQSLV